ncbi:MAG: D-amino acid dehydrogenase [Pseudomonadota bacterium]
MKICVLGAGVLGVTSAYELARSGHEVTVIERQPEPARECSFANGGQLSYSHAEPWANPRVFPKLFKWMWQDDAPLVLRPSLDPHMMRWGALFLLNCLPARARANTETMMRLGLYSKLKMAELMADTKVEFNHLGRGILHVFSDEKAFEGAKRQAEFQHTLGCEEVPLTVAQCFALEPALANTTKKLLGGMHAPIDESGDIHWFTRNLADYCAQRYGVTFLFNQKISRLHQTANAITHVEIEGQSRDYLSGFDAYVMALGSHSAPQLRKLGLYVPIYPMKGYSISMDASAACPQVSITDDAAKQVYSLLGNRMRVAGTAEFAGYNEAVRPVRVAPLIAGMKALFPDAPLDNLSEWACLRPSTPDGPPIIGKTPISNLFMNSGHGTLGWTQSAGSARLLADVINGKPTEVPMSGLGIERCLIRI